MTAKPWPSKLPIYDLTAPDNRFALGTLGQFPLLCFGINPSVANDLESDNTLRIISNFATRNTMRFDSWLMFNVYAQRSTKPQAMHRTMDTELHSQNLQAIARRVDGRPATVYSAWGSNIELRTYLGDALRDIVNLPELANVRWMHRGLTDRNHPHHPIGTPRETALRIFDILGYVSGL